MKFPLNSDPNLKGTTNDIKHEMVDPKEFEQTIPGVDVSQYFNEDILERLRYEWLETFKAYPSEMKMDFTHKVIISVRNGHINMVDGPNGDKNRYIVFSAYHILTMYSHLLKGIYFPMMFPYVAFRVMIEQHLLRDILSFKGQLLELHFKKKNRQRYELLYAATVIQKEEKKFERTQVHFCGRKYKP